MTLVLDGVSGQRQAPARTFLPGKGLPVPIGQEAGWAPQPVWAQRLEEKSSCFSRGSSLDRPSVQSLFRHNTDWATPAANSIGSYFIFCWKVEYELNIRFHAEEMSLFNDALSET
jgi:hypothetical protein